MKKQIGKQIIFYGWVVTAVSFLTIMLGTAVRQSIVILFPPILDEFGWSRATLSIAPSLAGFTISCCTLMIGILSDKWDIKRIIPIGALIASAGLLLCHSIRSLWQIYLYFGIITAAGVSALAILPNTIIVSNWFEKKRGAAPRLGKENYWSNERNIHKNS